MGGGCAPSHGEGFGEGLGPSPRKFLQFLAYKLVFFSIRDSEILIISCTSSSSALFKVSLINLKLIYFHFKFSYKSTPFMIFETMPFLPVFSGIDLIA